VTGPSRETDGWASPLAPREPPPPTSSRQSGPWHYAEADRYANEAAAALEAGDVVRAQALAAIGQVHATLAAASVAAL
jgi:hypothetical protein